VYWKSEDFGRSARPAVNARTINGRRWTSLWRRRAFKPQRPATSSKRPLYKWHNVNGGAKPDWTATPWCSLDPASLGRAKKAYREWRRQQHLPRDGEGTLKRSRLIDKQRKALHDELQIGLVQHACAHLGFCIIEWKDGRPFVLELIVDQSSRGRGIGQALVRKGCEVVDNAVLSLIACDAVAPYYKEKLHFRNVTSEKSLRCYAPAAGEQYMEALCATVINGVSPPMDIDVQLYKSRSALLAAMPTSLAAYEAALLNEYGAAGLVDRQPERAWYLVATIH
jgi:predicted N-acetyltransferase YhbS